MPEIDLDELDEDQLRQVIRERGLRDTSAEDLYGGSGVGGGGAVRTSGRAERGGDPLAEGEQFLDSFETKFNSKELMRRDEYDRYIRERLGRTTLHNLGQSTKGAVGDEIRTHARKLGRT